jgi:hypothetical protein
MLAFLYIFKKPLYYGVKNTGTCILYQSTESEPNRQNERRYKYE